MTLPTATKQSATPTVSAKTECFSSFFTGQLSGTKIFTRSQGNKVYGKAWRSSLLITFWVALTGTKKPIAPKPGHNHSPVCTLNCPASKSAYSKRRICANRSTNYLPNISQILWKLRAPSFFIIWMRSLPIHYRKNLWKWTDSRVLDERKGRSHGKSKICFQLTIYHS